MHKSRRDCTVLSAHVRGQEDGTLRKKVLDTQLSHLLPTSVDVRGIISFGPLQSPRGWHLSLHFTGEETGPQPCQVTDTRIQVSHLGVLCSSPPSWEMEILATSSPLSDSWCPYL